VWALWLHLKANGIARSAPKDTTLEQTTENKIMKNEFKTE
jgi:hypothetical protein